MSQEKDGNQQGYGESNKENGEHPDEVDKCCGGREGEIERGRG